ncbi:hypothetical protein ILYODFUR_032117 [Ilyodon furcidens]|uniref:OB domain-containing protein n=1 Tax=Ilyodon furcidens TaxID=33524 RepID=A0ABV0TNX9_9TELE
MKGYSVRGGSPPFALIATRETTFFRSSPVNVDETLMREATDVLWPHSILTPVAEIHNVKGLLTVEGNIVQLSAVSRVTTGQEEVPLRHLKLEQEQAQVTLCLWREAAVESVEVGTKITVTHVKLSSSAYGDQLQSTAEIEVG